MLSIQKPRSPAVTRVKKEGGWLTPDVTIVSTGSYLKKPEKTGEERGRGMPLEGVGLFIIGVSVCTTGGTCVKCNILQRERTGLHGLPS